MAKEERPTQIVGAQHGLPSAIQRPAAYDWSKRSARMNGRPEHARQAILSLLDGRAPSGSVCPSEAARKLIPDCGADAPPDAWRDMMPIVHAAVDALLGEGRIQLSWKGKTLATRTGPYRISVVPRR